MSMENFNDYSLTTPPGHVPPYILQEPKPLRFLYVPMYSSPHNLQTCSTYNYVKVLIKKMVENRQCYAYVAIPEGTRDQCAELTDHPRIEVIEMKASKNQYRDLCIYPNELVDYFNELEGEKYIDAVLTDKALLIPFLKSQLYTFTRNGCSQIPVGWIDQFFMRPTEHSYMQEHHIRSQIWGFAEADFLVWASDNVKQEAFAVARKYVSPSVLRDIINKSYNWFSAADIQRLNKYLDRPKRKDKIVLNYAYATNDAYKYKEVFEILNRVYEGGRDVEILVTTSSKASIIPKRFKESNVTIYNALPQEEFFEKVATQAHVFLYMPDYSELSQSVLEQQYLGLVGIFPNKQWAKDTTYPGYPYLANNKDELEMYIRHVVDNYWSDEVQEVIRKQREFILERFDATNLALNIYDHMSKIIQPVNKLWRTKKDLNKLFWNYDEIDYDTWVHVIKEGTSMGYDMNNMPVARYGLAKNVFRRLMWDIGFIDTCDRPVPHFKRVARVEEDFDN